METSAAGLTSNVVEPAIAPDVAVIMVEPGPRLIA